jgi:hypothetical protein
MKVEVDYTWPWVVLIVEPISYALPCILIPYMLRLLRSRGPPPDLASVHYSTEHVALAKTLGRRRWLMDKLDERIPLIR